jgi:flagellar biosynthetic protein FlhB
LVAKGVDELAMRIREVAKENDIPLYENKPLARAMYDTVELDEMVPEQHYKAVAEVISYVFQLKGKLGNPKS